MLRQVGTFEIQNTYLNIFGRTATTTFLFSVLFCSSFSKFQDSPPVFNLSDSFFIALNSLPFDRMTENLQELLNIDLPEEIWIHIFRYLDIKSKQNAELVCKKWLNFILNDVILSGEYTFVTSAILSSQVNAFLAKRKKLKTVRFPHLLHHIEGD